MPSLPANGLELPPGLFAKPDRGDKSHLSRNGDHADDMPARRLKRHSQGNFPEGDFSGVREN
jgi:hypothetical protein